MNLKKLLLLSAGLVSLGLGALGAVLPVLPTVPFLMLSAFCFARSSERLDAWFRGTRLYREHLEDFAAGRGMTGRTKRRILLSVSTLMAVGFLVMALRGVVVGCIALACVWLAHLLYFGLRVKTLPEAPAE